MFGWLLIQLYTATSTVDEKWWPFNFSFNFRNNQKSDGAKLRLYGGWVQQLWISGSHHLYSLLTSMQSYFVILKKNNILLSGFHTSVDFDSYAIFSFQKIFHWFLLCYYSLSLHSKLTQRMLSHVGEYMFKYISINDATWYETWLIKLQKEKFSL